MNLMLGGELFIDELHEGHEEQRGPNVTGSDGAPYVEVARILERGESMQMN